MIKVNRTWEIVLFTHKKQGGYRDITIELSINRDTTANTDSERWQVPAPRNRQMAPGSISPGWLDTWARESRHYARVTVTDAQGLVIASTDPTLTARQDDQTWWREAMQAKPGMAYVSTVVPDPRNSEAVFHIAVPLVGDPSGTTIGIVDVVVHRSLLTHMILPIHIGNTGHAMLLDTQGTPLICPVLPTTAHLIPSGLMSRLAKSRRAPRCRNPRLRPLARLVTELPP